MAGTTPDTGMNGTPDRPTLQRLAARLGDRNPGVRHQSRFELARIGPDAVPYVLPMLDHHDRYARWEAARTLEVIADPGAADQLATRLEDPVLNVRWAVAEALVALGPEALPSVLRELIHRNGSAVFREMAHHVLDRLRRGALRTYVAPVLEALDGSTPGTSAPVQAHRALDRLESQGIASRSERPTSG